jgi:hypothetical protein
MLETLRLLRESKIIESYLIIDFRQGETFYFLRAEATIKDGSKLLFREYVSEKEHIYSYHWQDREERLRIRWDNSPHHRKIKTYPHHKHVPEITESDETDLKDVIKVLEKIVSNSSST